jgi:serine protease Do
MSAVTDVQGAIAAAADRVGPAVVGLGRGWGLGSGVVIAKDTVLTTAHGLRSQEPTVLVEGERRAGQVAGADEDLDLAVITVPTGEVEPVTWDPEAIDAVAIGTPVLALADPGGRGLRVTPGFVSSRRRPLRGPRGRRIPGGIEHTAPLPRGSSGGPLVDLDGRLLGLNALRLDAGLILALPADATLQQRAEALARGEAPSRPRLGVAVAPARVARRLRRAVGLPEREGVLVRHVEDDSPAARAGVQAGDLIVAAGDGEIDGVDGLYEALDKAGPTLSLTLVRGAEERTVEVSFA